MGKALHVVRVVPDDVIDVTPTDAEARETFDAMHDLAVKASGGVLVEVRWPVASYPERTRP